MKVNFNKFLTSGLLAIALTAVTSCNKDVPPPVPITEPAPSGQTLTEIVNTDASFTILRAAVTRAGTNISTLLSDRTAVFTLFAPTDAAFIASGIPNAATISALPAAQVESILRFHLVGGQRITSAAIPTNFPNIQLPTQLVLSPPSASLPPGLRMSVFASKRGANAWVNNIPITQADIPAANGVVHKIAALLSPPQAFVWNRIDTDPNLTYYKAAIKRADEGVATASKLETALLNPAGNFTVFAPNDNAFRAIITALITQALVAQGVPPATASAQAAALASTPGVFTNPMVTPVLTQQTVQALVVYHWLGFDPIVAGTTVTVNGLRAFSVNFPTTPTGVKTFLNRVVVPHPGVTLQATFGATGVTAASVKGLTNPSSSNLLINPTPGTGTSDQNYINGVLHVIDQVLLPQ